MRPSRRRLNDGDPRSYSTPRAPMIDEANPFSGYREQYIAAVAASNRLTVTRQLYVDAVVETVVAANAATANAIASGPALNSQEPSQPDEEPPPCAAVFFPPSAESVVSWGRAVSDMSDEDDAIE
jgi:hypothetical protein